MINKKLGFKAGKAGVALGAVLLATLTGCVGSVEGPGASVYVAPPSVEVAASADYIYYPSYNAYYNSDQHVFVYMDGGAWVSRPNFPGVSVDVLLASPSVRMDFHDSPANHNAEIVRRYPGTSGPFRANQVQRSDVQKPEAARPEIQRAEVKKPEVHKTLGQKAPMVKAAVVKAKQKPEKREE
jgi:hypothetical protein